MLPDREGATGRPNDVEKPMGSRRPCAPVPMDRIGKITATALNAQRRIAILVAGWVGGERLRG